jgi:hypothetical protein
MNLTLSLFAFFSLSFSLSFATREISLLHYTQPIVGTPYKIVELCTLFFRNLHYFNQSSQIRWDLSPYRFPQVSFSSIHSALRGI